MRASLPPPISEPAPVAVELAHRFVSALVERDLTTAEAHLDANVCGWWTRRGRLSLLEGASELSRALSALMERDPPTRFDIRSTGDATSVTSSLVDGQLCWSLELNVADGLIVGAFVRGAHLEGPLGFLSPRVRG